MDFWVLRGVRIKCNAEREAADVSIMLHFIFLYLAIGVVSHTEDLLLAIWIVLALMFEYSDFAIIKQLVQERVLISFDRIAIVPPGDVSPSPKDLLCVGLHNHQSGRLRIAIIMEAPPIEFVLRPTPQELHGFAIYQLFQELLLLGFWNDFRIEGVCVLGAKKKREC